MKMNRRNVLIGIGTAAVGSGVALGSGAFTQVEASRTVNLQVSDDSEALLGLSALSEGPIVENSSSAGTNDAALLQIENTNLNDDATTKVEPALEVTNSGGQEVDFYVDDSTTGVGDALEFEVGENSNTGNAGNSLVGSGSSATLGGGSGMQVDVIINSDSDNFGDLSDANVTFVADAVD